MKFDTEVLSMKPVYSSRLVNMKVPSPLRRPDRQLPRYSDPSPYLKPRHFNLIFTLRNKTHVCEKNYLQTPLSPLGKPSWSGPEQSPLDNTDKLLPFPSESLIVFFNSPATCKYVLPPFIIATFDTRFLVCTYVHMYVFKCVTMKSSYWQVLLEISDMQRLQRHIICHS